MYCCIYIPNQPRPICCPWLVRSANNVVNPELPTNFGFFNNLAPETIEDGTIIPLALVNGRGTSITQSETQAGAIALLPGIYEISYMTNAVTPTGENVTVALRLNGNEVDGSATTASGTAGTSVVLGQTIVLDIPATGTLELANISGESVEFISASMVINRL